MLRTRPATLILLLCVVYVCMGAIAAVVCKDDKEDGPCNTLFSSGISIVSLVMCFVCCFALFYVESMGHRTGVPIQ